MDDSYFRMMFFGVMNISMFGAIYLYGRKAHPMLSLWLCSCTCVAMITLSAISGAWLMASVILSMVYLFILRKPNQQPAFQQLYTANEVYSTQRYSQAVFDKIGNRNWRYAEAKAINHAGKKITYQFWQGSTSSMVSAGQYTRTTVYSYYLVFVFPPGSVSDTFKQAAAAAADKSNYSWKQKLKYFFKVNTEAPTMVATIEDGSFILQYNTISDAECYARRFKWITENLAKPDRAFINPSVIAL